jgi:ADP-heptose:LPS heptosyltransferase
MKKFLTEGWSPIPKNPSKPNEKKVLLLHPTASTNAKYYPLSFWNECVEHFEKQYDEIEILCGRSREEISFCEKINLRSSTLSVNKSFGYLREKIQKTDLFIGLDSSLAHMASYYAIKTHVLWSFANLKRIYPFNPNASVFAPKEIKYSKDFHYPKKAPPFLKRASFSDFINNKPSEFMGTLNIPITYY